MKSHHWISMLMLSAGFVSCNNDLNVMAPYDDIPLVYGMLNTQDSVHYIRLEKSFMGKADAYDMARQTDSIYYPDASVSLERWVGESVKEHLVLERTAFKVRDDGVFSNDPNYLYQTSAPLMGNSEYHLVIQIPSTGAEVSAITHTVSDFKIIKPASITKTLAFNSYDNYLDIEWLTAPYARIYHLMIRFHYLEIENSDTVNLTADWNIGHYYSASGIGGDKMTISILQRNFYKWIGNKLSKPGPDVLRLADKQALDFVFTVGGEELYTYMEVNDDDSGILTEKPVFTNIVNGIGLFSSRHRQSMNGKALSAHSIDSLANGIYTKDLRFDDSKNDYYFR